MSISGVSQEQLPTNSRIMVAGGTTLVGRAIHEALSKRGFKNIVSENDGFNFCDRSAVEELFLSFRPEFVFCCAGRSGGIMANQKEPASLMVENVYSSIHIIECAHRFGCEKLLYLASSCVYPRLIPQPIQPSSFMTGQLEPTNEAYATAKICGIVLCKAYRQQYGKNFISAIPANPFGPGDDFSENDSHVIGALIRKMHFAVTNKQPNVQVWGTGQPRRDFIFSHDLADACIFVMQHYTDGTAINLSNNEDVTIADVALMVKKVSGYAGEVVFDSSRPDGMPRKCLDASALKSLGWKPKHTLEDSIRITYEWYVSSVAT